jgi:pimeloyl-ACP methyl ester carboxylesterase
MPQKQVELKTRFETVNGIKIAYEVFGEPKQPPVLLIMGLGTQMVLWDETFCRRLAEKGLNVIRFDNRDIGLSSHLNHLEVPDPEALAQNLKLGRPAQVPYTLEDMAADSFALIESLGCDSAHVVGESMGGMIGQIMAIKRPERVRSLTSIMSTTGNPNLPPSDPAVLEILHKPFPIDRSGYIDSFVGAFEALSGRELPIDPQLTRKWAGISFDRGLNPDGVVRQYAAILASGDRTAELKSLRRPTLIIHGSKDPIFPLAHAMATADAIPEAELKILAGMGHALPATVWPEIIAAIAAHAI